jgi:hypothetical protein
MNGKIDLNSSTSLKVVITFEDLFHLSSNHRQHSGGKNKSYDSWTNIREGFSDLLETLDPQVEVDKLVKYILYLNIPIRHFNVIYVNLKSVSAQTKTDCPDLKVGRFSRGPNGEDGKIIQNWEMLVKESEMANSTKCVDELVELNNKTGDNLSMRKRNVIGCYLAQNLPYIRHCADVFNRAVSVVYPWNEGKYTKEEDALILEEVQQNGANQKTWIKLAEQFKRRKAGNISRRFSVLTMGDKMFGKWTSSDYESFFNFLFSNRKTEDESEVDIKLLKSKDILEGAKVVNRLPHHVYVYWLSHIKPTLLSYHDGTLHTNWKNEFFNYLVNNKVNSVQEINWDDARVKFPNQSAVSLGQKLKPIRASVKYGSQPLYLIVKEYLEKTKHNRERENSKKFRERIAFLYDKARGVLKE